MNEKLEAAVGNIDSKIDRTREAVDAITDRAEQGVLKAADQLARQANLAGTRLHDSVRAASSVAHERLNESAMAIEKGYDRVVTGLSHATQSATRFISANPRTAIAAAASVGFVLGVLAHRHRPNA